MRSHQHPRALRRRALVALGALTLVAGACGAADDDDAQADGVASLRDLSSADDSTDGTTATDSSSDEGSELEAPEDLEEAMALYDQCLQDHGVDPGDGFVVAGGGDAIAVAPAQGAAPAGEAPDSQVFVYGEGPDGSNPPEIDENLIEASEACRGHLANATQEFDLTPEQEAALEDAQLAFQQCMEDHGIEGGGFSISVGGGPGLEVDEHQDEEAASPPEQQREIDPEQFQAAAEECQSVYEDYPELDDVLPDGGAIAGTAVGSVETTSGS